MILQHVIRFAYLQAPPLAFKPFLLPKLIPQLTLPQDPPKMKQLPYDIVFQIVQELKLLHDPPGLEHIRNPRIRLIMQPMKFASYATLNRAWNVATERESFQNLLVYSDDIPEHLRGPITTTRFKQMMSRDPARRRAITRDIIFFASVQSPLDSEEASTEEGRNANDRMFSASVRQFWEVLKEWPSVPDHRRLRLELRHIVIAPEKPVEKTDDDDGQAVEKQRRDEMYLNLPGGPLPRLRCISDFHLSTLMLPDPTLLWPPALLNILNSFHGLRDTFLNLQDIAVTERSLWTDYREGADQQSLTPAFAPMNMLMPFVNLILELSSIVAVLPNTIVDLVASFGYISRGYSNSPSYTSLALDPLSISLRDMSTRLVCLTLMDIRITPALFWPCSNEPASTPVPFWPHLQRLELWFAPLDPCGKNICSPIVLTHATQPHRNEQRLLAPWAVIFAEY